MPAMAVPKPTSVPQVAPPVPGRVDTRSARSLSFAPPDPAASDPGVPWPGDRPPLAVGPGRSAIAAPSDVTTSASDVKPFPIQASKIQPPVLRDETLARDRLLEWLDAKIHHRLVLVIAEAGYGKTTLLADFTRRTRLRTIWYRLDETDADWVTVMHHLVAAGRRSDPSFAPATWSLLAELGSGGAPMTTILGTFIRELQGIGDHGVVLILDDYHLVEAIPELQQIVRDIVTHAPERLTVVLLSRRSPTLPIARLRALGEVAELGRNALRFEPTETERLFRETYGRPLEPDVLAELDRRTEGWAASLQLVRSALRERSAAETRAFIASLSGARGTLHDFLAEEVVGDLDPRLQSFLMRTSILSTLPEEAAAVAAGIGPEETRDHLESATRIGLLPHTSDGAGLRYHPLVRDFLDDRLRREVGASGVADLHRLVARYGESADWKLAAHHYEAAGDLDDVHRVMVASMQDIMGGGGFALAESYVRRYADMEADPTFGLFLSRRDAYNGDFTSALARAKAAVAAHPSSSGTHLSHLALANLATITLSAVGIEEAGRVATELVALHPDPTIDLIARGTIALAESSTDGDLLQVDRLLREALDSQSRTSWKHYRGITLLNLAGASRARGAVGAALQEATQALALLASSSEGSEMATAHLVRGWAMTHLASVEEGRQQLELAGSLSGSFGQEVLTEVAEVQTLYGDPDRARALLEKARMVGESDPDTAESTSLAWAEWHIRAGEYEDARAALAEVRQSRQHKSIGFLGRWLLAQARMPTDLRSEPVALEEALRVLTTQHADYWLACARVLEAVGTAATADFNRLLLGAIGGDPAYLTVCAADLVDRLDELDDLGIALVRAEVSLRPSAWRPILRRSIGRDTRGTAAAALLDQFGEASDVPLLRAFSRRHRSAGSAGLGRSLARRLAPPAHVEDLGHLVVRIGDRTIDGSLVRRKVLSLICFLVTKPGFAATRDQVLEALWPDLDPSVAVNSLNQTVYFLRRVFEPAFREDESAEYVRHDGEVVRLDAELVSCESSRCRALADQARPTLDRELVERLAQSYRGRFAIDFEYEDWASPYRETLHAAYLDVIEQAVRASFDAGEFEHAGWLARTAIDVDPEAESLEAALLRVYRNAGSHAAAAEQYSHYSSAERADGIEPEPLDRF